MWRRSRELGWISHTLAYETRLCETKSKGQSNSGSDQQQEKTTEEDVAYFKSIPCFGCMTSSSRYIPIRIICS
jgi:hypothetical protein